MSQKTKLTKREEVAEGTMAFHLEKPSGFQYKAGQFVDLKIINPPETDNEGNVRTLSIASAPEEDFLMVATRMRDTAFKRSIRNLPLQSEIQIDGPFGSFTLHNDASKPAVFLIGGIGITPIRSILVNAAKRGLSHNLFLFYSNRRPEDAAFLEELISLQDKNHNYKLIATMTDLTKSNKPWTGEKGYIDEAMIKRHLDDLMKPIYYVSGPPQMVTAIRELLNRLGVSEDNIKFEEFAGY